MAKKIINSFFRKPKVKRKGVHSKNKSRTKGGSQYEKPYNSQGR